MSSSGRVDRRWEFCDPPTHNTFLNILSMSSWALQACQLYLPAIWHSASCLYFLHLFLHLVPPWNPQRFLFKSSGIWCHESPDSVVCPSVSILFFFYACCLFCLPSLTVSVGATVSPFRQVPRVQLPLIRSSALQYINPSLAFTHRQIVVFSKVIYLSLYLPGCQV